MFRATAVHQHVPYSNKTTTHAPSRLVTCAECRHTATPFVKKKTTRVRCLIWQPSQTQPRQYVRRLLSATFCSASVHSPHAWRTYYLMSEVSTEQCMLWSFYYRWVTVYYTRYELYILYSIIPGTKGISTFQLIRHTYVPGTCIYAMNTSFTCRPVPGFYLEVFWICCRAPINR